MEDNKLKSTQAKQGSPERRQAFSERSKGARPQVLLPGHETENAVVAKI